MLRRVLDGVGDVEGDGEAVDVAAPEPVAVEDCVPEGSCVDDRDGEALGDGMGVADAESDACAAVLGTGDAGCRDRLADAAPLAVRVPDAVSEVVSDAVLVCIRLVDGVSDPDGPADAVPVPEPVPLAESCCDGVGVTEAAKGEGVLGRAALPLRVCEGLRLGVPLLVRVRLRVGVSVIVRVRLCEADAGAGDVDALLLTDADPLWLPDELELGVLDAEELPERVVVGVPVPGPDAACVRDALLERERVREAVGVIEGVDVGEADRDAEATGTASVSVAYAL